MSEYCLNCGLFGVDGICDHCSGRQSPTDSCNQEPDIVPCFKCGTQMYQECHAPEGNICTDCELN